MGRWSNIRRNLAMRRGLLLAALLWALVACQPGVAPTSSPIATPPVTATSTSPAPTATVVPTPTSAAPTATRSPHAFTGPCRTLESPGYWAERLYFQGRGYKRLSITGVPDVQPFMLAGEVGRTFAPWQAGSANTLWYAPPRSRISAVQGIPPEEVLAVTRGTTTDLFCAQDAAPSLAATRAIRGRVVREVPMPICDVVRCFATMEFDPEHLRAAVEVVVQEVWHGATPAIGQTTTVVTLRQYPTIYLAPGDEVVLLIRPQETLHDFRRVQDRASSATPVWVAEIIDQYRVEGDRLRWVGDDATTLPLADFRAGLADTFAGVTPSDPPIPSPRP